LIFGKNFGASITTYEQSDKTWACVFELPTADTVCDTAVAVATLPTPAFRIKSYFNERSEATFVISDGETDRALLLLLLLELELDRRRSGSGGDDDETNRTLPFELDRRSGGEGCACACFVKQ